MKSTLLYIATVLIWGTTWLAIEYQLGVTPVETSLFYRFALATLLMWGWVLYRRLPMGFEPKDHFYILLLALMNFSINYYIVYWAQVYLTSAVASIAFTSMLLMNIVNTRIFFGKPIAKRVYAGALMGIAGIAILFWPDLQSFDLNNGTTIGLGLTLIAALVASLGNMVSVRNGNNGIPVIQANAWGMLYASIVLFILMLMNGSTFTISSEPMYIASLVYLALFGTVIAFACYFVLLKNIGPEKASYVIVLFPLVAVSLSIAFEGLEWNTYLAYGFLLTILGNVIVLTPFDKIKQYFFEKDPGFAASKSRSK